MTTASGHESAAATPAADREFEDKTIEKAVEAACVHFGVSQGDLEIEILTRGSTGIFGLGGRKARIRAKQKERPSIMPPVIEGPRDSQAVAGSKEEAARPADRTQEGQKPLAEQGLPKGTLAELAQHLARDLLEKAGLRTNVQPDEQGETVCLQLSGPDLSLVIGKEGQTLDALEYIINRMVSRKAPGVAKISLDAEGYRQKREQILTQLAQRVAAKARRTGRSVALQPMPPRDRRIVHMVLRDIEDIRTRSVGEGDLRKVMIIPARRTFLHGGRPRNK